MMLPSASASFPLSKFVRESIDWAQFEPSIAERGGQGGEPLRRLEQLIPRRVVHIDLERPMFSAGRYVPLASWEGVVTDVSSETFNARLVTIGGKDEYDAEIPVDEVAESDRDLLAPGAVFYWYLGYRISVAGTRERSSVIRFRRLPAWTQADLTRVENRTEAFRRLLGECSPEDDPTSAG